MYNMHPHISTQHYSALLRRNSRRLERKYRHTGSATDRLPSVEHERMCHKVYRHKESAFWNAQLTDNVEHVSHHSRRTKVQTTANQHPVGPRLSRLIQQKVEAVRKKTGQGPATTLLHPTTTTMNCFQPYTEADIAKVITAVPSKSCELNPMPTDILKQFLPVLLLYITKMCNASLHEGILPTSQCSAIVTPRLKKAGSWFSRCTKLQTDI